MQGNKPKQIESVTALEALGGTPTVAINRLTFHNRVVIRKMNPPGVLWRGIHA
jgi:hypothetical protein